MKMERFVFNKYNIVTFIIALVAMILGYIVMGMGDKTISVILLILSYVVFFPLSIVIGFVMENKNID